MILKSASREASRAGEKNPMNGADALISASRAAGIDVCFANPGTTEMSMVDALTRSKSMRPVLVLFEGVGSGAAESYERQALTARGAKYRIAIPMTRTCGRALSYVAVIRSVSPAGTGRPAGSEKPVIATGPGSCMTGRGSMPHQTG